MKHNPHCEKSPTSAHHYDMSWPEPGVYQGVCRYCGHRKQEDANLGMDGAKTVMSAGSHVHIGKKSEFRLRAKGRFYAED